jgi:hypothetical protein
VAAIGFSREQMKLATALVFRNVRQCDGLSHVIATPNYRALRLD